MSLTLLLGEAAIDKGPSDVVIPAGWAATFACTLNVTGNEMIQFQVWNNTVNDRQNGCEIDETTYTKTVCSWPDKGMNMTCDYSIPYQITCDLTLCHSSTTKPSQITCSSPSDEGTVYHTAYLNVIDEMLQFCMK